MVPTGTEEAAGTGPGRTRCCESSRWHTLLCIGIQAQVGRGSTHSARAALTPVRCWVKELQHLQLFTRANPFTSAA